MGDITPDAGTGAAGTPPGPPEMSREDFRKLMDEHKEELTLDQNVGEARIVAQKLLIALNVPAERSREIVNKYIDELIGSMQSRLEAEGKSVRTQYEALSAKRPDMQKKLDSLTGFTDADRKVLETIIDHFGLPDDTSDGKSYLTTWMRRDATNGNLVQVDYEKFQEIQKRVAANTPEAAYLGEIYERLRDLRRMDPTNLTFIKSSPSIPPGARFALSCLLAGIGIYSLLMSRKTGKIPKKGLIALGLLVYLNRNMGSKLDFVSTKRYEEATKNLRGTPEGERVIEALGGQGNREAVRQFAIRERLRVGTAINDPRRKDLIGREESYGELASDLGLSAKEKALLLTMEVHDITDLAGRLQRFSTEELDIAKTFVRRAISSEDIARIPLEEKAGDKAS